MSSSAFPPRPPSAEFGGMLSTVPMGSHAQSQLQIQDSYGWDRVKVLDEGRVPCQRSLHAAAVWNDSLFVFGGYDGHSRVNDMYEYNFQRTSWRLTPPSMVTPSPRDRHAAVVNRESFYIFGGFDGSSRINDFWGYNFQTQGWAMVPVVSGDPPSPRHSHMAVTYNDSMFVFGGYDGSYRADFHEYNFQTECWRPVAATGKLPRCRYRASCVVYQDLMIMFGGHDGNSHLNDTNVFNFITGTWTQVSMMDTTPSPRDSHTAVVYGDSMFVFGGSTGEATDDFYELKLGKFRSTWNKVARNGLIKKASEDDDDDDVEVDDPNAGEVESTGSQVETSPRRERRGNASEVAGGEQFEEGGGYGEHKMEHAGLPGRRFCHVAQVFEDSLYVFGGYDGRFRLNDFIRFRFGSPNTASKIGPSTLVSELKSMVNNPQVADVVFICDDGARINAHKFMLIRCEFFRAMLLGSMAEGDGDDDDDDGIEDGSSGGKKNIILPAIAASSLLIVLEYLYTDEVDLGSADVAMDLFQAADRFGIPRLKSICENVILKSICVENAASIFYAADMYNAKTLREKCLSFMLMHFSEITKTAAFEEMGRTNIELVFEFLKMIDA